jgi:hypothetical protein
MPSWQTFLDAAFTSPLSSFWSPYVACQTFANIVARRSPGRLSALNAGQFLDGSPLY